MSLLFLFMKADTVAYPFVYVVICPQFCSIKLNPILNLTFSKVFSILDARSKKWTGLFKSGTS